MNRRKQRRITLRGIRADISDGRGFYTGSVHDLSRSGLSIDDIPARINSHAQHLIVIVDGQGGHFKLRITPKWETAADHEKNIGGLIELSPTAWTTFVRRFEPDDLDFEGNS